MYGLLTDAGGTYDITTNNVSYTDGGYDCNNCGTYRTFTAGTVTAKSIATSELSILALLDLCLIFKTIFTHKNPSHENVLTLHRMSVHHQSLYFSYHDTRKDYSVIHRWLAKLVEVLANRYWFSCGYGLTKSE